MRLRHIKGSEEEIEKSPWAYHSPEELQAALRDSADGGDSTDSQSEVGAGRADIRRPLYVEIGMGKGRFIMQNAAAHPDIRYIGIEMYESVMVKATRKLDAMAEDEKPGNLRFIRMDARDICDWFPEESVDRIYLNFSDPWPKTRHASRRLVSEAFLRRFRKVLKPGATVEFKTDNRDLFDFGLEEYEKAGFDAEYITYDLHHDQDAMKDNIMTEYEERFSAKGNPICKYILKKI